MHPVLHQVELWIRRQHPKDVEDFPLKLRLYELDAAIQAADSRTVDSTPGEHGVCFDYQPDPAGYTTRDGTTSVFCTNCGKPMGSHRPPKGTY